MIPAHAHEPAPNSCCGSGRDRAAPAAHGSGRRRNTARTWRTTPQPNCCLHSFPARGSSRPRSSDLTTPSCRGAQHSSRHVRDHSLRRAAGRAVGGVHRTAGSSTVGSAFNHCQQRGTGPPAGQHAPVDTSSHLAADRRRLTPPSLPPHAPTPPPFYLGLFGRCCGGAAARNPCASAAREDGRSRRRGTR